MNIRYETTRIIGDGGAREAIMIYADGALVSVFAQLVQDDAAGNFSECGWFLEAGFGPCTLHTAPPAGTFQSIEAAIAWTEAQLRRKPVGSDKVWTVRPK